MKEFKSRARELARYPSAMVSLALILLMLGVSIYTMITIPYGEAIRLWRGSEEDWYKYPKQAAPAWVNYFSSKKQPVSFFLNSTEEREGVVEKTVETRDDGSQKITITYTFDYQADDFPQDIMLYSSSNHASKKPLLSVVWLTPDGRKINMASYSFPSFPPSVLAGSVNVVAGWDTGGMIGAGPRCS